MKRRKIYILVILCLLLTGCGTQKSRMPYEPPADAERSEYPEAAGNTLDTDNVLNAENIPDADNISGSGNITEEDTHVHIPFEGNNIVEHEAAGYCGNTVTTIKNYSTGENSENNWEISFWGDDSVSLTDLLLYLDYKEDICRCIPEYTVDTEFGENYHVNLTEGYVRHGDKQASLTAEQTTLIQNIIETNSENNIQE